MDPSLAALRDTETASAVPACSFLAAEDLKPTKTRHFRVAGFEAKRAAAGHLGHALDSEFIESFVERTKLAIETQIEQTLVKQHAELMLRISEGIERNAAQSKTVEPHHGHGTDSLDMVTFHTADTEFRSKSRVTVKSINFLKIPTLVSQQRSKEHRMLQLAMRSRTSSLEFLHIPHDAKLLPHAKAKCTRFLQSLQDSPAVELVLAMALCANAVFIGVEVNYMATHLDTTARPLRFVLLSYAFTLFFMIELAVRLMSGCRRFMWASDAAALCWNYLDIALVLTSLIEIGFDIAAVRDLGIDASNVRILRVTRPLRLIRLMHVARLVRFVAALRTLCYSICVTLQSFFWAMVLVFFIIYVSAILFTQSCAMYRSTESSVMNPEIPNLDVYWGTIRRSMLTLLMSITGWGDWGTMIEPLTSIGRYLEYLFLTYFLFTYFVVLNVVTGCFCQAAIDSTLEDKFCMMQAFLKNKKLYTERFKELYQELDSSGSGKITLERFADRMHDDAVQDYFASLGLSMRDAICLFDIMEEDETIVDGIPVEEFVMGCLRLKGNARSSDVIRLLHEQRIIRDSLNRLLLKFEIALSDRGSNRVRGVADPVSLLLAR